MPEQQWYEGLSEEERKILEEAPSYDTGMEEEEEVAPSPRVDERTFEEKIEDQFPGSEVNRRKEKRELVENVLSGTDPAHQEALGVPAGEGGKQLADDIQAFERDKKEWRERAAEMARAGFFESYVADPDLRTDPIDLINPPETTYTPTIEKFSQETPPDDWEEPDESVIQGLVDRGLIKTEQVFGVEPEVRKRELWDLYRNSQLERKEGESTALWAAQAAAIYESGQIRPIVDEIFAAQPLVQLAALEDPSLAEKPAFDYFGIEEKVKVGVLDYFLNRYGDTPEVRAKAEVRSNIELNRVLNSHRGAVFFLDRNRQEITEDMSSALKLKLILGAMQSPVLYGTGEMITTKQLLHSESFLSQFGRLMGPLSTLFSAMAQSGEGWDHPDTLKELRKGAAIWHQTEEVGQWIMEHLPGVGSREEWERKATERAHQMKSRGVPEEDIIAWVEMASGSYDKGLAWTGAIGTLGIIFTEPDPFSMLLGLGGVPLKMAKTAKFAARYIKAGDRLSDQLRLLREGQIDEWQAAKRIEEADYLAGQLYRMTAQHAGRYAEDVAKKIAKGRRDAIALEKKIAKIEEEIAAEAGGVATAKQQEALMGAQDAKLTQDVKNAVTEEIDRLQLLENVLRGVGKKGEDLDWRAVGRDLDIAKTDVRATKTRTFDDKARNIIRKKKAEIEELIDTFQAEKGRSKSGRRLSKKRSEYLSEAEKLSAQARLDENPLSRTSIRDGGPLTLGSLNIRRGETVVPGLTTGGGTRGVYSGPIQEIKVWEKGPYSGQIWVKVTDEATGLKTDWLPVMNAKNKPIRISGNRQTWAEFNKAQQQVTTTWLRAEKNYMHGGREALDLYRHMRGTLDTLEANLKTGKQINKTAAAYEKARVRTAIAEDKLAAFKVKNYQRRLGGQGKKTSPSVRAEIQKVLKEDAKRLKAKESAELKLARSREQRKAVEEALESTIEALYAAGAEIKHKYGGIRGALSTTKADRAYYGMRPDDASVHEFTSNVISKGIKMAGEENAIVNVDRLKHVIERELLWLYRKGEHGVRAKRPFQLPGKGQFGGKVRHGATPEEAEYLNKVLTEFMEHGPGAPLKQVYDIPAKDGTRTLASLSLDLELALPRLQTSIEELAKTAEGLRVYDESRLFTSALAIAWKDLGWGGENAMRRMVQGARRFAAGFDNAQARWGTIAPELADAARGYENSLTLFQHEMLQHTGSLKANIPEGIMNFLDKDGVLRYGEAGHLLKFGPTKWGTMTGEGSAYEKARRFIISDSGLDPAKTAEQSGKIEERRKALLEKMEKEVPLTVDKDGKVIPDFAEPIELSMRIGNKTVKGTATTHQEMAAFYINNYSDEAILMAERAEPNVAIRTLSKMWIPSGVTGEKEAPILLGIAYGILAREETYRGFATKMQKATFGLFGRTDKGIVAHGQGASAIGMAASLGHFNYMVQRAGVAVLDAGQAADINNLMFGSSAAVKDINKAWEGLNRLGMPATEQAVTVKIGGLGKAQKVEKRLIELGTSTEGGSSIFVPKALVDDFVKYAGDIEKELLAKHPIAAGTNLPTGLIRGHMNLWRQSVVTGLILPNPRYWTNNIAGDLSQMWTNQGLMVGSARTFTNFFSNLPFIGRPLQEMSFEVAEKVGGKSGTRAALPSAFEAMFNPWIGRVFKGEDGRFITKHGRSIDFKTLRHWAEEDGIGGTFVQEELVDVMIRSARDPNNPFGPTKHFAKWWQGEILDHATLVQQRQRMGLYAHLLQSGVSRAEAKRKVLDALYDWKHGLALREINSVTRMMPFYRFWRLAMRQISDALIEPMVSPMWANVERAARGNTKIARLRQQAVILPNIPEFLWDGGELEKESLNRAAELEELGKLIHPRWMETRAKLGYWPIDAKSQDHFARQTGKQYTHMVALLPTFTSLDTLGMAYGMMAALAGLVLPDEVLSPDYTAQYWEPFLSSTYPLPEIFLRQGLGWMGADLEYRGKAQLRGMSAPEEWIWWQIPPLKAQMHWDSEEGKWLVPNHTYSLFRNLPFWSTQLSGFVRPGLTGNPHVENWNKGMAYWASMIGQLTRFYDVRPTQPYKEAAWQYGLVQGEADKLLKEKYAVPVLGDYEGPRTERLPGE